MRRLRVIALWLLTLSTGSFLGGCSAAHASALFVVGDTPGYTIGTITNPWSATALSFSLWFAASGNQTAGSDAGPISFENTGTAGTIGIGSTGANQIWILETPASTLSLFTGTTNSWYFLGCTVATSAYNCNYSAAGGGTLTNVNKTDATAATTYNRFWIGAEEGAGAIFKGSIACVKVWSGATLTAAELYNEQFHCTPTRTSVANLVAWYPMYQQSDFTVDYSANANTLTAPATKAVTSTNPPIAWQFMLPVFLLSLRRRRLS